MNGRNTQGRFTHGNTIAMQGWQGLVRKQFNGNSALAKEWLRQLVRFGYSSIFPPAARTSPLQWRYENLFCHPGGFPLGAEAFVSRFQFTLGDLPELAF